jgi:citrate synthase
MSKIFSNADMQNLCDNLKEYSKIDQSLYTKFHVKRGLRRSDGTGVLAGITNICNVHGYVVNEGEKESIHGELFYRGYNIFDLVKGAEKENRFGFEETAYLLLFGNLPTSDELEAFNHYLSMHRELPSGFVVDMMMKAPSKNIMNKLARSILSLYSYNDADCEDVSIESELRTAISLIAKLPILMVNAYQVKRKHFDNQTLFMHPLRPDEKTAETILSMLRPDRQYTPEEARLLDTMLMIHAEHGGGNNSTFTCRVLTSSGTDAYSAYSSAVCALKGPKHGGANLKVSAQLEDFKKNIKNWENEGEVADYIRKVLRKEAGDGSGLVYGMGHAVYTLSDPRAVILKKKAFHLAKGKEIEREFLLLDTIERLTPILMKEERGVEKAICANVDMYSGLVYRMLQIPEDLYTPLFAVSRMAGWSAHRMEELMTGGRIIRPAYKALPKKQNYVPISER